jgi:hypothetical protein
MLSGTTAPNWDNRKFVTQPGANVRYKLRTLLALTICCGVFIAIHTNWARKVALARNSIVHSGAELSFEYQLESGEGLGHVLNEDASSPIGKFCPASLKWLFPERIFRVNFNAGKFIQLSTSPPVNDDTIRKLSDAGSIRELGIYDGSNLTDSAFELFCKMPNLERIDMYVMDGVLTDKGFKHICSAPGLKSIDITGGSLDGNSLRHLSGTKVDNVMLVNTGINDDALNAFSSRNPRVTVWIQGRATK